MNREILFRGKRIDNGEWVYGYYLRIGEFDYILTGKIETYKYSVCHERFRVASETVGQCTCIPDGNNRKMYDGDICCFSVFGIDRTIVKISYRYGTPGFEQVFPEQVHPDNRRWYSFYKDEEDDLWNPHYFRVIGNIHDNPELLEGVQ